MKYWLFIVIPFILFGCGEEQTDSTEGEASIAEVDPAPITVTQPTGSETIVKGNISQSAGSLLQLNFMGQYNLENKGNATIGEDGSFELKFSPEEPGFYNIRFSEDNALLVYLEPGTVTEFNADGAQLFESYELIQSGEDSRLLKEFFTKSNAFYGKIQEINAKMEALGFSEDKKRAAYIKESDAARTEFNTFKRQFIDDHSSSPVMVFMIDHLDAMTEQEYIEKVRLAVNESLPNTHYSDFVDQSAKRKKQEYFQATASSRIQPGKEAPEIEFPNPEGEIITLSSLEGKVVLLDFWASWCKPCRAENPNVVNMYNRYKDKGFEVFSFSLDKDKTRWVNAIAQDGLTWPNHASDLKGWQTAAMPVYGFNSIPFTVLIGRDGKIIETNLRGPALENKLQSILG